MFGSAGVPTRPAGYTGDGLTGRLWNTTSCLTAAPLIILQAAAEQEGSDAEGNDVGGSASASGRVDGGGAGGGDGGAGYELASGLMAMATMQVRFCRDRFPPPVFSF
jgi:hypothetical protein